MADKPTIVSAASGPWKSLTLKIVTKRYEQIPLVIITDYHGNCHNRNAVWHDNKRCVAFNWQRKTYSILTSDIPLEQGA